MHPLAPAANPGDNSPNHLRGFLMRRAVALTASVVFIGFLVACGSRTKTPAPQQSQTPTLEQPAAQYRPYDFDFNAVSKEWRSNSVACKDKYFGKWFYVSGRVWTIMDKGVALRTDDADMRTYVFSMPKEEILKIKSRQKVVLIGVLLDFEPEFNLVCNAAFGQGFVKSIEGVIVAEKKD